MTHAQQVFLTAKERLFAACKLMQEHEDKIVEQMATDTAAARELSSYAENIEDLVESMVNYRGVGG